MTKTHRHRQSRQSAQSPEQRSDASLLSWEQLTERLQGAVSVEVEEPFVDLKLLVPRDALLVVHLDHLDLDFSTRHTDLRLKLALDTVAALCVVSERLRPDASRHTNFWQRVLTSEAAKNPAQLDDRNVLTFARFTRLKPMRVVFSWSGRKLPTAVIKSLQNFLNTPTAHHDAAATALQGSDLVSTLIASRGISPRPVKVGLRITDCSLDVKGLAVVRDGLRISGDSSPSPLLCDRTSLHVLDISGNELQVNSLHAVAQLIEDPTTRSLDGLFLKRAFPTDSTKVMVKGFAAGVGRMLKALLTRKPHTSTASLVEGVALSLAHNHFFDGVALRALAIALVKATRPLRSLSLAYTKHSANPDRPSDLSWFDQHVYCQDFIRVTMTSPVSSFTPDSVLDITMAKGLMLKAADTLFKHMAMVVRDDIVPLMELAFLDGQSVHCTLRRNQVMSKPEELYWLGSIVPPGFEFEVLKVGDAGWLHVQYPDNCDGFPRDEYDYYDSDSDGEDDERDDGEEEQEEEEAWDEEEEGEPEPERKTGWAQLSMLATLRIGDDDTLSMRFSGVVRNADVEEVYSPWARLESAHLPDLLAPWSHKLRALSLRAWRDQYVVLPQILFTCRNLLQLDLQGSRLNHEFSYRRWEQARVQTLRLRELQAVNLSGTDIPVTFIRARLKTKRPLALRYLSMRDVPFDGATLTQLLHFVQRHSCLEFAEFDKAAPAPTDTSAQEAKNRRELAISIQKELQSKLLETDALPLDRKIAFLSALASLRLGRPTALLDVLEKHIVPNIFDFAAGEVRSIAWCAPAAVKKWTPPST